MKLIHKELIELNKEVPTIETTKEGLLRGGFVSLATECVGAPAESVNVNVNFSKYCSCSCDKNKGNCSTTETTGTTDDTTVDPTAIGNFSFSMLF